MVITTWRLVCDRKGLMDFVITFSVRYIFSPECPLSKAKNDASHIHKTTWSLLSDIHKKVQNMHLQEKCLASTICHLTTENFI